MKRTLAVICALIFLFLCTMGIIDIYFRRPIKDDSIALDLSRYSLTLPQSLPWNISVRGRNGRDATKPGETPEPGKPNYLGEALKGNIIYPDEPNDIEVRIRTKNGQIWRAVWAKELKQL